MTPVQPPKFATWLLKNFGGGRDNDAMLGDLDERFRGGRSQFWYWKQVAISIVVSGRNDIYRHRLTGILIGALVGAISIADNIAKYDRHSSSASPYFFESFIAPILVFAIARYSLRRGTGAIEIRSNIRRVARFASLLFGVSYFSFILWWHSVGPWIVFRARGLEFLVGLTIIPAVSGFFMYQMMKASGYIATRLPMWGVAKDSE